MNSGLSPRDIDSTPCNGTGNNEDLLPLFSTLTLSLFAAAIRLTIAGWYFPLDGNSESNLLANNKSGSFFLQVEQMYLSFRGGGGGGGGSV